ncbi:30S ribosomal protein S17 [Candidatus Daviesbacteria bacterium RIFCSPHIGHO2_02_FULL_36_13]|uniref:30S ribosomal protein S17 n=1 Tax=Candidatus Daviesbacteria bacterium RIFCSPHIGHO2_02_FULL_36_13 TaxID=1797768 RepID=A0A1F5JZ17_9BACT|nr:MAG: 30S ribosomal protein S17 [Candidatus Daviesbacteria bacterium RIFCSPHIGHO2_02_FULL_36_13]OGE44474.1 MAG: 30S ribosomal protein S17 [Candidatus Daviesbacteria bacterium RIFCSPLOWO2_01_FULL_36_8]
MVGRVVSAKLKGTVTVLIERVVTHPLYKKTYKQSKKYLVDDAVGVKLGDIVDIANCRPISKNKHWKVAKVLGRDFAELATEAMMKKAEEAIAEVMPEEKQGDRVQGLGSSEEVKETKEVEEKETKKKRVRKEKLVTKP